MCWITKLLGSSPTCSLSLCLDYPNLVICSLSNMSRMLPAYGFRTSPSTNTHRTLSLLSLRLCSNEISSAHLIRNHNHAPLGSLPLCGSFSVALIVILFSHLLSPPNIMLAGIIFCFTNELLTSRLVLAFNRCPVNVC